MTGIFWNHSKEETKWKNKDLFNFKKILNEHQSINFYEIFTMMKYLWFSQFAYLTQCILYMYIIHLLYTKDFAFNQTFQLIYEGSEITGLTDCIGTPTTMAHALGWRWFRLQLFPQGFLYPVTIWEIQQLMRYVKWVLMFFVSFLSSMQKVEPIHPWSAAAQ